jgi:hypothetical protein
MQGVGPIVDGQGILLTIDGESALLDPVCTSAYDGPKVWRTTDVLLTNIQASEGCVAFHLSVRTLIDDVQPIELAAFMLNTLVQHASQLTKAYTSNCAHHQKCWTMHVGTKWWR